MRKTIVIFWSSLLILGSILLISANSFRVNNTFNFDVGDSYPKMWRVVDSLENKGLPKSALKVVAEIYELAKKDKNSDQIIKSFIYQLKFKTEIEEYAFESKTAELEKEAFKADFPNNAIMHSMLAEMYWMYYQQNSWTFRNRSVTVNFKNDDIQTWDLNKLADKVIKHYVLSLKDKEQLQKVPTSHYEEVIVDGSKPAELRPTLYDFLAHRAIDFFSNTQLSLTQPIDKFELAEEFYFSEATSFVKQDITTSDTLSLHYYGMKTLQDLLSFRLKEESEQAFIDADIKRLTMVRNFSVNPYKDSLYLEALKNIETKYNANPFSSEASYLIAKYYEIRANKYRPLIKETFKNKWDKKTALEICDNVIVKFPKSSGAIKCKSLKSEILVPHFSFTTEAVNIPNEYSSIKVSYKNFDKLYLKVLSVDRDKYKKFLEKYYYGEERYKNLLNTAKDVYQSSIDLPNDGDFQTHEAEALVNPLSPGFYLIILSAKDDFVYSGNMLAYDLVDVSSISYIKRVKDNGAHDFYVMNRKSGKPSQGVKAQTYYTKYDYTLRKYKELKGPSFLTNIDGYFEVLPHEKESRNYSVEFSYENDFLSTKSTISVYERNYDPIKTYRTTLFTDRGIYRPGQTIHFKGIVINSDGEENEIVKSYPTIVTLYDVNSQKVSELSVTTNEYGTFSGSFTIPTGNLNGQYHLKETYGSAYVSVEEYKRPKFEAEILPFEGNYRLNDEVTIKGKATTYAGSMLTEAEVSYRIVRRPIWRGWWYYDFDQSETEIKNGKTQTDEKGEFEITFTALPDLSLSKSDQLSFNYHIYADVTDLNGETQSTSSSMVVGYKALQIGANIPAKLNKNNSPFDGEKKGVKIITENSNGQFIPAEGELKIFLLKEPDGIFRSRKWSNPDNFIFSEQEWKEKFPGNLYADEDNVINLEKEKLVLKHSFNTEKDKYFKINDIKKWNLGRYVVEITSKDAYGQKVEAKKFFTIFDDSQTQLPFKAINYFSVIKRSGEPGETAKFLIGSAEEDVHVIYEIEHKRKIVKTEFLKLSNNQQLIEIPIKEEHRGNFSVHFIFIKENRLYQHSEVVTVPYTNKELDIEFGTFRSKLYPGQDEEWQITIKGKDGERVAAEMLATLYDASLDNFRKNYWYFDIYKRYYTSLYWSSDNFNAGSSQSLNDNYYSRINYYEGSYSYFNWFGFNYYSGWDSYYGGYGRNKKYRMKSSSREEYTEEESMDDGLVSRVASMSNDPELREKEMKPPPSPPASEQAKDDKPEVANLLDSRALGVNIENNQSEKVQVRTNFNETAFFLPNLSTNEKGDVIVKFTIPESLTKWRMMGFAHTQDLKYGFVENELITQKELMVMPNAPRFFRQGDKIEFPVKISNVSDKDLSGNVSLELLDGITMKPIEGIFDNEISSKPFTVKSKLNALVTWKLKVPDEMQVITYRVIAKTKQFSDGEEKPVPVLTNRMLVTESMPMPMRSNEIKTFKLDKLIDSESSTTIKHHKLTLEFTSNPAWYAIQALPYLMEYPYECAEQTFSRYYANSIASHIANSNPKVKNVFDSWKNTPDSKALLSNLEKNQELKAVLLEETPWVLNSQNESERKRRVGLLFDLNKMADELGRALKKLQDSQVSNGAWPWFKGMPESRYITQHIVTGMGHLDKLGVKEVREDDKTWRMLKKAVNYLDSRIVEDYQYLKKHYSDKELKENHLSYIAIQYMYGRSYFTDISIPAKTQEALKYFKEQSESFWLSQSKYMQGMIALSLHRFEKSNVSQDIVKSLKEHSITHQEIGMYWKENVSGYYWYQAPIETQALMIEVFDEVVNDEQSVDDLKVWLLKQKQTQDWRTTKATVEACYALLRRGDDWLANDELVKIKVGDIVVDPKKMDDVKVEAGTGYFKTSWGKGEITPNMGIVNVEKPGKGIAWGALYWQYFENLDKITPHETPLKLQKKLFRELDTDRGKVIEPIEENTQLHTGDKIVVRIELRVDRAMEYVHMKDMRASGFEPINVISRYKWQDGLGYYESTKDAATNFFIDYLPKGTFVFEYPLRVTHNGDFSNGITTIQCMYAPEFTSHSEGVRVNVEKK